MQNRSQDTEIPVSSTLARFETFAEITPLEGPHHAETKAAGDPKDPHVIPIIMKLLDIL